MFISDSLNHTSNDIGLFRRLVMCYTDYSLCDNDFFSIVDYFTMPTLEVERRRRESTWGYRWSAEGASLRMARVWAFRSN